MNFSEDIIVSAKSKAEAKKKAWEKFIKRKVTKKKNFQLYADLVD